MAAAENPQKGRRRGAKGFARTSTLLETRIRKAGETRGFAVMRLLTHWTEIAGEDIARISRPVKVGYARQGLGATLTLLTTGANAPILEMQKDSLREKVNSCYGYAAISRIRITQTAPTGFAEGQAAFVPAGPAQPDPARREIRQAAQQTSKDLSADVHDERLRAALEALGANILSRSRD